MVITGFPSSGKSTRAAKLAKFFKDKYPDLNLNIVNDSQFTGFDREETYSSSRNEKNLRAYLKSEVQKYLNKETLVIVDSLNYIKGYRYELFCVTKSAQTPHCVIWCDAGKDASLRLNEGKTEEKYSNKLMDELMMRYEEPNGQSRWDAPLFIVQVDMELDMEALDSALFKSKPPTPNMSTVAQPLQATNFMYELDRITNETIKHVVKCQKGGMAGDTIKIPSGGEIKLLRHSTLAELNKIRRQFITYMKLNPMNNADKLSSMFAQYLQTALQ